MRLSYGNDGKQPVLLFYFGHSCSLVEGWGEVVMRRLMVTIMALREIKI